MIDSSTPDPLVMLMFDAKISLLWREKANKNSIQRRRRDRYVDFTEDEWRAWASCLQHVQVIVPNNFGRGDELYSSPSCCTAAEPP